MAGSTLDQFTTFWESTGSTYKTGLNDMVNEAVKNTYTFPRLQAAHSMEDMVQAGANIKDRIFFKVEDTTQRINPDEELSYVNNQTGVDWTVPWSILVAHTSWNKWELGLNTGQMSNEAKIHLFKDVRRQKFQNLYTSLHNRLDAEMWATPDSTKMEVASGNAQAPYSIPVFVNEHADGIPLNSDASTAFTTVMGITPGAANVDGKWKNQAETYTYDSSTALATTPLFTGMSKLMTQCKFDRLPKNPEFSDKSTSPHFIGTSLTGLTNYENALRVNQDEFRVGRQDPDYPMPMFRGVPVDYIAELDTAALYANTGGTALVSESAADKTGPRYYFLNGEYLRSVFHSDSYFEMVPVITPEKQPFNRVQLVDITNNLVCRSRQRQGILSPFSDTTDA